MSAEEKKDIPRTEMSEEERRLLGASSYLRLLIDDKIGDNPHITKKYSVAEKELSELFEKTKIDTEEKDIQLEIIDHATHVLARVSLGTLESDIPYSHLEAGDVTFYGLQTFLGLLTDHVSGKTKSSPSTLAFLPEFGANFEKEMEDFDCKLCHRSLILDSMRYDVSSNNTIVVYAVSYFTHSEAQPVDLATVRIEVPVGSTPPDSSYNDSSCELISQMTQESKSEPKCDSESYNAK